ncbi:MAG: hypothetical protein LW650_04305 [Planctomycetaceae bacterium]|jgi:DNA-damage-inducible protein D|nr:hypothetical protein [Phycisphaerales bacterium]MCE2652729.1 hypothetical protein [Planctomycetaceae bacterium]
MKRELIGQYFTAFGAITRQTEGVEYWHARDLQGVLGYAKWDNFVQVIDRAKVACANSGQSVADHFADVGRMVDLGSGAQRQTFRTEDGHVGHFDPPLRPPPDQETVLLDVLEIG